MFLIRHSEHFFRSPIWLNTRTVFFFFFFSLDVNHLPNSSERHAMFADDTNLFFTDFSSSIVNEELDKIYEWFNANKLSLHVDKTNNSLFHKSRKADDLPLLLPTLLI